MEKRQSLQQMLLGKLDIFLQKTETRSMPVIWFLYHLNIILKIQVSTRKSREYTGSNRYREGLPQ
jgi:hypothetical protein